MRPFTTTKIAGGSGEDTFEYKSKALEENPEIITSISVRNETDALVRALVSVSDDERRVYCQLDDIRGIGYCCVRYGLPLILHSPYKLWVSISDAQTNDVLHFALVSHIAKSSLSPTSILGTSKGRYFNGTRYFDDVIKV